MTNRTDALTAGQASALDDIAADATARGLFVDALRDFAQLEDWDYEAAGYAARATVLARYRYEVQAVAERIRACPGWVDQHLVEAVAVDPEQAARWAP